ncbi:hypothetical protein ACFXDJ_16495 [Streptomyces sp. NPDC059443]|uniref:hypothetical protein n=1 Tax=unclassified Streptomyces TaxID=2593676 RepID=UPI0036A781DA
MIPLSVIISALMIPKEGNSQAECEDAYCVVKGANATGGQESGPIVAAISDGASESMLASVWSGMISWHAAHSAYYAPRALSGRGDDYAHLVDHLLERWDSWVVDYSRRRSRSTRPLQWYDEVKLASGSFATLLAVRLDLLGTAETVETQEMVDPGLWEAAALGDSCLFQIRENEIVTRFPVESSTDFGLTPDLLASRNSSTGQISEHTRFMQGTVRRGDDLFLMTDALAAWFLALSESGTPDEFNEGLRQLRIFSRAADIIEFQAWISSLVADGNLRNDDVTFIHIDIRG